VAYAVSGILLAIGLVGFAAEQVGRGLGGDQPTASLEATGAHSIDPAAPRTHTIGRSVKGRLITATLFGSGRRRVLIVGGIHGNEFGTDVATRFRDYLLTHPQAVPTGTVVFVVPCLNPDGRAAGIATNARNVDINRNFPARNWTRGASPHGRSYGDRAGSEPETRALIDLMDARFQRIVSLHSKGPLVDYDGPGSAAIATDVARAMGMPTGHFNYSPTNTGSLGWYAPERLGVPVITVELTTTVMTPNVLAGLLTFVQ
jgi:protein MpaA